MIKTRIAGALAALALLAAPAVAAAHGSGHHHGKSRHHHKHHLKKAQAREVTGTATATVQSFANNELTIALPSGKTFSATVGDDTIIKCETAAPQTTATASSRGDDGDDDRGDDDAVTGDNPQGDDNDDDDRGGRFDDGDDDNDQGDENGNGRCDATALVAGAKVTEAKLSLTGGDATWKKVELLT
jgi:hypothetical protein